MLNEGLTIMATGMTTVFSFLIILWMSVALMGEIVGYLNKIFPEQIETAKTVVKKTADDTEIAIAVALANMKR